MPPAEPTGMVPLTLLESRAVEVTDSDALLARVSQNFPLNAFLESPLGGAFFHRSGVIHVGDVAVSCSRHSPLEIGFDDSPTATLTLPLTGVGEVATDGQRLKLEAGPMAAYLPGAAFTASTGTFEEVMICLDRRRLAETAAAMGGFGASVGDCGPAFERTLRVDGSASPQQADLLHHLHLALRMLEAPLLRSVGGLRACQLEDLLFRLVAAIVCPEVVNGIDHAIADQRRDRPFEDLLEWIQANLHAPITATELSRRSAYSQRNLQYLFQRRFGCSPMQWVKRQRLSAVHADLLRAQPGETVGAIARRHGFVQMSSFAARFRESYGLTPSQLLRRSRLDAG
ncbi:helix-turn-helix domain-containing protein [Cyanobium sp. Copco_Reservoir_LC18]|uniref:helix-turn-helix domain-containing protein n=1 Tax=Cyanobium sp. Copco_Reservoir_LC18 TaxID=1328305 RepID=UPI0013598415|nr:AraC family transcriptional regulator [Cyanobium sp. Copco_Reservoir_LC18]